MKKIILCTLALALLLCACATPADTTSQADVSEAVSELPEESQAPELTASHRPETGRALADLKAEHPDYVYAELDGPDFFYASLAKPDKSFGYVFFGGQDEPGMAKAAETCGEQFHSAGIYSTVGDFFPIEGTPLSVDDFLAAIGVTEVDYWFGWLEFVYDGYGVVINTGDGNADDVEAKPTVKITADMPFVITDRMAMEANGNMVHTY